MQCQHGGLTDVVWTLEYYNNILYSSVWTDWADSVRASETRRWIEEYNKKSDSATLIVKAIWQFGPFGFYPFQLKCTVKSGYLNTIYEIVRPRKYFTVQMTTSAKPI